MNKTKTYLIMELIDKEKVEIILRNLWKKDDGHNSEHSIYYNKALQEVQCEIDTLETKEVDLGIEITLWANAIPEIRLDDVERLAKYFFEFGLKAKGE